MRSIVFLSCAFCFLLSAPVSAVESSAAQPGTPQRTPLHLQAEGGDVKAQAKLGRQYLDGKQFVRDPRKALHWLSKASDGGVASAQIDLGHMYESGDGVPKDLSVACYWYRKAADQGDAIGQCNYGTMLIYGTGCNRDAKAAKELFEKAAAQKHRYGYYELGVLYEQGLGVEPEYKKAFEYYKLAALAGVREAMNNLATMHAKGQIDAGWSPLQMYTAAAEQGNALAEFNVGMLYLDDEDVPHDHSKAVEWLTKAAEHGIVEAQCNLGVVLVTGGEGVAVDTVTGLKWLKKAADAGDNLAKEAIARINREGLGVPKDEFEAARWNK